MKKGFSAVPLWLKEKAAADVNQMKFVLHFIGKSHIKFPLK